MTVASMIPTWDVFGLLDRVTRSPLGRRPAITFEGEDRTFAALRDRALRVARGLRLAGVGPGDRVAVLLGNRHEWPEVFFGIAAVGAVCVPINVLLTGPEISYVCHDSEVSCLIADRLAEKGLAGLEVDLDLVIKVDNIDPPPSRRVLAYAELLADPAQRAAGPVAEDPFILYYSSGTTGAPKAAVHTHRGVLWNSFSQIPDMNLTPDDVYLVVPSLSWAAGFHDVMLALAWLGGRSVLMPTGGTTPERILAAIEHSGATHCLLVPTLLRQFAADSALLERLRRSTMRAIVTGAEPVPKPLIETLAEELPDCRLLQAYGLSEFPTIATTLAHEDALTHVGSAGRPLLHTDIAVQTDNGAICTTGEGELLIRSPATMRGYYKRPEETREVFASGWLHTGDRVQVDEQRYVTIVGRTKDMIISGGLNVYPKEVEEVVYRLPNVAEVAVVGVPDDRWGETPVAIVVPERGAKLDVELVRRTCREQLASYKRPREIFIRADPLPRNPTGKLLKRMLRPWAAEQLRRADEAQ